MPSNLLTEPYGTADIAPSSGTLGLGAESGLKRDKAPLQSQSCNISACSPIYIGFITTSTFEQLSLSIEEHPVFLRSVATFWTALRSLCSWNFNDINAILPCHRLNRHPEFGEWYSMNFSVGSLRLLSFAIVFPQVLKFLNCNYSIVFHCNLNNFMCNLPYPRVYEVSLLAFEFPQGSPSLTTPFICIALQNCSTFHELPLLVPYILSKIKLLQNFSITSQNRQSKATAVNINPYNGSILLLNLKLLSKVSNNNVMSVLFVQPELCTNPTIFKMLKKSFISSILLDWQGNSATTIKRCNNNNRITTPCFGKLSRTRNVKPDWNLPKPLASLQILPYMMDAINENLGVQAVFLLDNRIGGGM